MYRVGSLDFMSNSDEGQAYMDLLGGAEWMSKHTQDSLGLCLGVGVGGRQ